MQSLLSDGEPICHCTLFCPLMYVCIFVYAPDTLFYLSAGNFIVPEGPEPKFDVKTDTNEVDFTRFQTQSENPITVVQQACCKFASLVHMHHAQFVHSSECVHMVVCRIPPAAFC
jgi:hypothetical protein